MFREDVAPTARLGIVVIVDCVSRGSTRQVVGLVEKIFKPLVVVALS